MARPKIDLTGFKKGKITVIRYSHSKWYGNKSSSKPAYWECSCDCGKIFYATKGSIDRNKGSCGCDSLRGKTHGMCKTGSFKSWSSMISRCTQINDGSYKYYGGRGIKVCDRWLKFENFYKDMGERPADKSIDRIDVNGNYEPSNCKWSTRSEQQKNKRRFNQYDGYRLLK